MMEGCELEVFVCKKCGNSLFRIEKSSEQVTCCGEMLEPEPENTGSQSSEKHLPVYEYLGTRDMLVRVGSTNHPMTAEHHISWIAVCYNRTIIIQKLEQDMAPQYVFTVYQGHSGKIYTWCNLHGLWVADF